MSCGALQSILKLLMTGKENPQAGVMIPIPQYPLYTATIAEYNAYMVCDTASAQTSGYCRSGWRLILQISDLWLPAKFIKFQRLLVTFHTRYLIKS